MSFDDVVAVLLFVGCAAGVVVLGLWSRGR
jgi:hypothetical protein